MGDRNVCVNQESSYRKESSYLRYRFYPAGGGYRVCESGLPGSVAGHGRDQRFSRGSGRTDKFEGIRKVKVSD